MIVNVCQVAACGYHFCVDYRVLLEFANDFCVCTFCMHMWLILTFACSRQLVVWLCWPMAVSVVRHWHLPMDRGHGGRVTDVQRVGLCWSDCLLQHTPGQSVQIPAIRNKIHLYKAVLQASSCCVLKLHSDLTSYLNSWSILHEKLCITRPTVVFVYSDFLVWSSDLEFRCPDEAPQSSPGSVSAPPKFLPQLRPSGHIIIIIIMNILGA